MLPMSAGGGVADKWLSADWLKSNSSSKHTTSVGESISGTFMIDELIDIGH